MKVAVNILYVSPQVHHNRQHYLNGNAVELLWPFQNGFLFYKRIQDCRNNNWGAKPEVATTLGYLSAGRTLLQVFGCIVRLPQMILLAINLQTNKSSSRYCNFYLYVNLRLWKIKRSVKLRFSRNEVQQRLCNKPEIIRVGTETVKIIYI